MRVRLWLSAAAILFAFVAASAAASQSLSPGLFVIPTCLVVLLVLAATAIGPRRIALAVFVIAAALLVVFILASSATVGIYFLPSLGLCVVLLTLGPKKHTM